MTNPHWKKIKPFALQIVLLLVIGLLAWFGIRPLLGMIQLKMDDLQKLAVTRDHREKQLDRLTELEAQHALIITHQEKLDIVLTKDRLVEFIETLERLATENGVVIAIASRDNAFLESKVSADKKNESVTKKNVVAEEPEENVSGTKSKPGVAKETGVSADLPLKKYLKLTTTVTGEYADIIHYLHQVETLDYALDVISMSLQQAKEDGRNTGDSGVANPFGVGSGEVVSNVNLKSTELEAVFELVVYMKDEQSL